MLDGGEYLDAQGKIELTTYTYDEILKSVKSGLQ